MESPASPDRRTHYHDDDVAGGGRCAIVVVGLTSAVAISEGTWGRESSRRGDQTNRQVKGAEPLPSNGDPQSERPEAEPPSEPADESPASPAPDAPPVVSPAPESEPPREPDLATEDVHCINCGYNLHRLEKDGRCPECGTPIERSMRGNVLVYSSPEFLRRLRLGIQIIFWGLIGRAAILALGIVGGIAMAIVMATRGWGSMGEGIAVLVQIALIAIDVLVGAAIVLGWWLLSTPDPAIPQEDQRNRLRWWVRTLAVVVGIAAIMNSVGGEGPMVNIGSGQSSGVSGPLAIIGATAGLVLLVAWIAFYFLSMKYFIWLGTRIPDQKIVDFAKRMRWLGPVLFIVGAPCVMLGPLAAFILYIVLIHRLKQALEGVEQRQAEENSPDWAGTASV